MTALKKIRHIGIIGENLHRTVEWLKGVGLSCTEVVEYEQAGASMAFFPIGDTMLELICHNRPDTGQDALSSMIRNYKGTSTMSVSK